MEWVGAASPLIRNLCGKSHQHSSANRRRAASLVPENAAAAATRDEALRATLAFMASPCPRARSHKRLTDLGVEAPRGGAWSQKTVWA